MVRMGRGARAVVARSLVLATLCVATVAALRSQDTHAAAQAATDVRAPTTPARAPLLADLSAPMGPIRVRPVDPRTLADVPDLAPIEVGHHYSHALSPDGQTLAVVSWPSGSNNAGA